MPTATVKPAMQVLQREVAEAADTELATLQCAHVVAT